ncbi:MAG: hypothetical protein IJH36_11855, partial [Clostridia bacterium]|nr:hypothetical protein [Clostridia bacterium]
MVDVHQIYSNVDGNFNLFDALGVNNVLQTGVTAANFSLLNPGLFTIDTSLAAYNGNEYVVIRPNTSNLFGTTTLTVTTGEYIKNIKLTLRPLGQIVEPVIAAGRDFSVALRGDGTVWAWGLNDMGQLGDGTNINRAYPVQVMTTDSNGDAEALSNIKLIAAGETFALAVRADGVLYAWGDNTSGQLGVQINNTLTTGTGEEEVTENIIDSRNLAVEVTTIDNVDYKDITAMAAGQNHAAIVIDNNEIYTWGSNKYGQLGTGTENELSVYALNNSSAYAAYDVYGSYVPEAVKGFNGGETLTNVIDVKAGSNHTLALRRDGSVFAWGYNYYGQLGDRTQDDRVYPVQVFKGDATTGSADGYYIENISRISAKGNNSAAIGDNTKVFTWGDNRYSQLGGGSFANLYSALPVIVYAAWNYDPNYELANIMQISVGFDHMTAVDYSGNVSVWGTVVDEQGISHAYTVANAVAAGETDPAVPQDSTTSVLTGIRDISAGNDFTVAMDNNGNLLTWGEGDYGQIGNSGMTDFDYPVYTGEKKAETYLFNYGRYTAASGEITNYDGDASQYIDGEYNYIPVTHVMDMTSTLQLDLTKAESIVHPGFSLTHLYEIYPDSGAGNASPDMSSVTFISDNPDIVTI